MCVIYELNTIFLLKEQIYKCLSHQFDLKTSARVSKTQEQDNACMISLTMLYENRKSLILKVFGVFVYCFIEKYVCVEYFCLQRKEKMSSLHRWFEDNSFDELSGIGIPEILLNIKPFHDFIQDDNSTLILTCRGKVVLYYL